MKHTRWLILILPLLCSPVSGEITEVITPYQGVPIQTKEGATFDGESFTVPGRGGIPRNDVRLIEFQLSVSEGPQAPAVDVRVGGGSACMVGSRGDAGNVGSSVNKDRLGADLDRQVIVAQLSHEVFTPAPCGVVGEVGAGVTAG